MSKFNVMYHHLLESGIYFGPSGYEVGFISSAHSKEVLQAAAEKICDTFKYVFDPVQSRE